MTRIRGSSKWDLLIFRLVVRAVILETARQLTVDELLTGSGEVPSSI